MFPKYRDLASLISEVAKIKSYIISLAYTNFEDDYEVEQINSKLNDVITNHQSYEESPIEIEKNYLTLCHLMEEHGSVAPHDYSVIQFYSKLNYISEKIERENAESK